MQSIGERSKRGAARQERLLRRIMRRVQQVKQELQIPRRKLNFQARPSAMPIPAVARHARTTFIASNPTQEGDGPHTD